MKICLLNIDSSDDLTHWRNEYSIFCKLAKRSRCHEVIAHPSDADIILLCGGFSNAYLPVEAWRQPGYSTYSHRCVRIGTEDHVFAWWPGLYPSIPRRHSGLCFKGGPYPHVALLETVPDNPPIMAASDDPTAKPYLYSFVGAFDTDTLRFRLGEIQDERALIKDTSMHPGRGYKQSASIYEDYRQSYARSLESSRFILCPRGKGPSSIRIFEAMKAGRVPVIISDDWTPPPGPDWARFSFIIPENDIANIPKTLRLNEHRWPEMRAIAHDAWCRFFSLGSLFDYLVDISMDCHKHNNGGRLWVARTKQMATWRFIRRGLISYGANILKEKIRSVRCRH